LQQDYRQANYKQPYAWLYVKAVAQATRLTPATQWAAALGFTKLTTFGANPRSIGLPGGYKHKAF
jgi:hypothetical protein